MAIERKFIKQNMREFKIRKFIEENLSRVGLSDVTLKKTPLGDKIVIHASRPGLVVGRGGANIQMLTRQLKEEFELDNPQIEIEEVPHPDLDADIVAERICNTLERFGSGRTKGIGHRAMADSMRAGALGIEILISGKIPSMRARRWRFYNGYLKKAGDIAVEGVLHSTKMVSLKSGAVGVQVSIMPPGIKLPDHITLTETPVTEVEGPEDTESMEAVIKETAIVESSEAQHVGGSTTPDAEPKRDGKNKPSKKAPAKKVDTVSASVSEDSGAEDKNA